MIDIEKFHQAVSEAENKVKEQLTPVEPAVEGDDLLGRMDWLIARDNLCIVEGIIDSANAQHLATEFRQSAVGHVRLMREFGPSPATGAILDFYTPMLDVVYNTHVDVVNSMPPISEEENEIIPRTIV